MNLGVVVGPCLARCRLAIVGLLVLSAVSAAAQSSTVFLERQAHAAIGIPFLPGNVLPHTRATYAVDDRRIEVFVVAADGATDPSPDANPVPGTAWSTFFCGDVDGNLQLRARSAPQAEGVVYAELTPRFSAFFAGPLDNDEWCSFASVFASQFSFFLGAIGLENGVPMPAVLSGVRIEASTP